MEAWPALAAGPSFGVLLKARRRKNWFVTITSTLSTSLILAPDVSQKRRLSSDRGKPSEMQEMPLRQMHQVWNEARCNPLRRPERD